MNCYMDRTDDRAGTVQDGLGRKDSDGVVEVGTVVCLRVMKISKAVMMKVSNELGRKGSMYDM
jgi:hypothetical protein